MASWVIVGNIISYLQVLFHRPSFLISLFVTQLLSVVFCGPISGSQRLKNDNRFLLSSSLTGRQPRSYPDAIIFPETVWIFPKTVTVWPPSSSLITRNKTGQFELPDEDDANQKQNGKVGNNCITIDGKPGFCRTTSACETYIHFQLSFTHRVVECGFDGDILLICCPRWINTNEHSTKQPQTTFETSRPLPPSSVPVPALPNNDNNKIVIPPKTPSTVFGLSTPSSPQDYDLFGTDEVQEVCGVFESHELNTQENKGVGNNQKLNNGAMWPWIVSIGRKHKDGSINFRCLGTMITKESILSTAQCAQRNPNVVFVGQSYLGFMSSEKSKSNKLIQELSAVESHAKYSIFAYQNIGIVRLKHPVHVTPKILPVCFPFLAGVLDIIPFVGFKAKTIGFDTSSKSTEEMKFGFEEYTLLNNTQCSRIFNAHKLGTRNKFPRGIKSDNMCGLIGSTSKFCQAPGAPLVIFDSASGSHVIIGISTGDSTCNEFKRQIVTFTRINAFSTWIRERVGKLPDPPPCYVD